MGIQFRKNALRTSGPAALLRRLDQWVRLGLPARDRLVAETLERCGEALEGRPLRVLSRDPRLLAQRDGAVAWRGGGVAFGVSDDDAPDFE